MTFRGTTVAMAVFGLVAAGCTLTKHHEHKPKKVHKNNGGYDYKPVKRYADSDVIKCQGANACKGKSECMTATNACKGNNECKGKGWVKMTAGDCRSDGGAIIGK